jgi:hypothetical protein
MMRLVEHRWNGAETGWARQDVLLRTDDRGYWEVELRAWRKHVTREYETETEARHVVEALTGPSSGPWQHLPPEATLTFLSTTGPDDALSPSPG